MNTYEDSLLSIAPWSQEILSWLKTYNDGSFLRTRTGWADRGIEPGESIYEHTCKLALATHYLLGSRNAVEQAIIHDAPELIEADYMPGQISKDAKKALELDAMNRLRPHLPQGDFWYHCWEQYEQQSGISALIWELDKICPVIQARNYLQQRKDDSLREFYPSAQKKVRTPELLLVLEEMQALEMSSGDDLYVPYFERLSKTTIHI